MSCFGFRAFRLSSVSNELSAMLGCITGVGLTSPWCRSQRRVYGPRRRAQRVCPENVFQRQVTVVLQSGVFSTRSSTRGNRTDQYRTPDIDRCRSSLSLRPNHLDPTLLRMKRLQVMSRQLTANTSSQDGESFWAGVPQVWCYLDQPLIECSGSRSGKRAARTCCVMCSQPC
jgi:hypothetical protein